MLSIRRPQTRHASVQAAIETGRISLRDERPPTPPSLVEHGTRRALVTGAVMLAALLQTIDTTIVNVALPTIQGNLGATVDEATWIVTAYVIANVVVIPIAPWLQRRFGRKNYFLVSVLGFTLASILCGMATSLDALIVFRVIQGAFGGGLLSTAQMILRDTFGPGELGLSQSIFAFGTVLGPSIGPTLGGIITDNSSWQWIFDVNILPGIAAAALLWLYLRDNAPPSREPVDTLGLALLIATVGSLQYVLDQGQLYDWFSDARIVVASLIAVTGAAAFVWRELTAPAPIVDLRVLRHRTVAVACITIMANAVGTFGGSLLLPQFTVEQLGFSETQAGLLLGARAFPLLLLVFPIGRLTNNPRLDLRLLIGGGLLVQGIGVMWLAQAIAPQADFAAFVAPQMLSGIGLAFIYSPLLVATLRAVPAEGAKASALIILSFQLGGSIAAATLVTMVGRRAEVHQAVLAAGATLQNHVVAAFLQTHSLAELSNTIASQSAVLAFGDAILAVGVLVLCSSALVVFLKQGRST